MYSVMFNSLRIGLAALLCICTLSSQTNPAEPVRSVIIDLDDDLIIDRLGQEVTIEASVTTSVYPAFRYDEREYRLYAQDDSGGIRITSDVADQLISCDLGHEIMVTGILGQYQGMPHLEVKEIHSNRPGAQPPPRETTWEQFDGEALCGQLIRMPTDHIRFDAESRHYVFARPSNLRLFLRPSKQ